MSLCQNSYDDNHYTTGTSCVANVIDNEAVANGFELKSHFRNKTLWKTINLLIPSATRKYYCYCSTRMALARYNLRNETLSIKTYSVILYQIIKFCDSCYISHFFLNLICLVCFILFNFQVMFLDSTCFLSLSVFGSRTEVYLLALKKDHAHNITVISCILIWKFHCLNFVPWTVVELRALTRMKLMLKSKYLLLENGLFFHQLTD